MKVLIRAKCSECENNTFRIEKEIEGKTMELITYHEILCHDGFGYDINTFKIICDKCGKTSEEHYYIKELK